MEHGRPGSARLAVCNPTADPLSYRIKTSADFKHHATGRLEIPFGVNLRCPQLGMAEDGLGRLEAVMATDARAGRVPELVR